MSNFKALQTDNSKTGPSANSIFYRPQSIITDQYRNERIEQQKKQEQLLSDVHRAPNANGTANAGTNNANNSNRRRPLLKPVARIAIGGNRKSKNGANHALPTNKPNQEAQKLSDYKKRYSRAQFDTFKKDQLPPGTVTCNLYRKSLGCHRAFVGHFVGSKGPKFARSKVMSIREDDLQTKLERIQFDKFLHPKKKEELIAKLKFGLEDGDESSRRRYNAGDREWHFHFTEAEPPDADSSSNTNKKQATKQSKTQPEPVKDRHEHTTENDIDISNRVWLGKPKQEDKNYTYVVFEWMDGTSNGCVYPASFIEFGLSTQLLAAGHASAESAEKRHRQQLEKWRKSQAEKSMMEKLGKLFGHDDDGNLKQKKKKLGADSLSEEALQTLKSEYMGRTDLIGEEHEMLQDVLGQDGYAQFLREYEELHHEKRGKKRLFGLVTGDDEAQSLIQEKTLSKRLKSTKTRGQLDELNDYDEFMSDDEDENNLNNHDRLDDHEEDLLSEDDGNQSDKDESFKKLEHNLDEDLTNKEYPLPEKNIKDELENDSDVEDGGGSNDIWSISDDDSDDEGANDGRDDDEDDDMGGVTIKRKKRKEEKKADEAGSSGKEKEQNDSNAGNARKRKLDAANGSSAKRRKLNAVDEKKLKEELMELVTKLLKKYPNGLAIQDLWSKIVAAVSAEAEVIKRLLKEVIPAVSKAKKQEGGGKLFFLKK